jgi:transposase
MAFLDAVEVEVDERIPTIHLVCDHVRTHHGKEGRQWSAHHPRGVVPCPPVQGSWMNEVEQWFSIRHRHRWRIVAVDSQEHLRVQLEPFIRKWNQHAPPFNWSTKSVAQVMAEAPALAA